MTAIGSKTKKHTAAFPVDFLRELIPVEVAPFLSLDTEDTVSLTPRVSATDLHVC